MKYDVVDGLIEKQKKYKFGRFKYLIFPFLMGEQDWCFFCLSETDKKVEFLVSFPMPFFVI